MKGTPVDPAVVGSRVSLWKICAQRAHPSSSFRGADKPFGYIRRSFAQTTPAVMGAMRLLAQSYDAKELNRKGFDIYCDFRPTNDGWGKKSEMRMSAILALRQAEAQPSSSSANEAASARSEDDDAIGYDAGRVGQGAGEE